MSNLQQSTFFHVAVDSSGQTEFLQIKFLHYIFKTAAKVENLSKLQQSTLFHAAVDSSERWKLCQSYSKVPFFTRL